MLTRFVRFVQRLREGVPLSAFWRGLLLRRYFRRGAGLILSLPGGPRPIIKNHGTIIVESCCFEVGVRIEVHPGATLFIGKGTYFNRNAYLVVAESVLIGRDVKVGWDVVIMDTDLHGYSGQPTQSEPVVIEDEVWIGCRALILKGVHVGKGAIVAAGAIVTRDVPPLAVVASPSAGVIFSVSSPSA